LETIIRYAQSSKDWKPSSGTLKVQKIGNHHQERSKFKRLEIIIRYVQSSKDLKSSSGTLKVQKIGSFNLCIVG
jgi:hypothetical protein